MEKKKFSSIRYAWKSLYTTDQFINETYPRFVSALSDLSNGGPERPETSAALLLERSGSKNTITLDYAILTDSSSVTHVFLETKELFEFLMDSPVKDISFAKLASSWWDDGIDTPLGYFRGAGKTRIVVVHHQRTDLPSIKVLYQHQKSASLGPTFYVYVEDGETYAGFAERINPDTSGPKQRGYLISNLNDEEHKDKPMYRYARMALNLLLYEKCFPDHVRDGVPENIANPGRYRKRTPFRTFRASDRLLHKGSVSPHFRSGYFKVLSSDYFVNKKGQVIFVESTFVKGKAETIEPSHGILR